MRFWGKYVKTAGLPGTLLISGAWVDSVSGLPGRLTSVGNGLDASNSCVKDRLYVWDLLQWSPILLADYETTTDYDYYQYIFRFLGRNALTNGLSNSGLATHSRPVHRFAVITALR